MVLGGTIYSAMDGPGGLSILLCMVRGDVFGGDQFILTIHGGGKLHFQFTAKLQQGITGNGTG